jgi:hypothetical protein
MVILLTDELSLTERSALLGKKRKRVVFLIYVKPAGSQQIYDNEISVYKTFASVDESISDKEVLKNVERKAKELQEHFPYNEIRIVKETLERIE